MYSSEAFGRLFWVDDELEFMSCPMFQDGTGDFDREEYVDDHFNCFGFFPCDVEVDGKIYLYEDYMKIIFPEVTI